MKPTNHVKPIRIINPSIDDYEKTVVIRGVVDNDSLQDLRVDFYQRELLPSRSRRQIADGLVAGDRLPDIVLGMRGDVFEMPSHTSLLLCAPVYIIDGRQRRDTILENFANLAKSPRLGAMIHLNTTAEWERLEFHKLNQFQSKVSPNIILRNDKEDHAAIATLYGLTQVDKNFVMYNLVSWQQNMLKGQLITASTMLVVTLMLHGHLNGFPSTGLSRTVPASDKLIDRIGLPIFRENVKTFFNLLDECWGVKRVTLRGGAPWLRQTMMVVIARFLSNHQIFWKQPEDKRLQIPYLLKQKLAKFPMNDPEIVRLASTSGAGRLTLYLHVLNHMNSGKRTGKLVSRNPAVDFDAVDDEEVA